MDRNAPEFKCRVPSAAVDYVSWTGQVNMDRNAPDFYCESTEESLAETARFISELNTLGGAPAPPGCRPESGWSCAEGSTVPSAAIQPPLPLPGPRAWAAHRLHLRPRCP